MNTGNATPMDTALDGWLGLTLAFFESLQASLGSMSDEALERHGQRLLVILQQNGFPTSPASAWPLHCYALARWHVTREHSRLLALARCAESVIVQAEGGTLGDALARLALLQQLCEEANLGEHGKRCAEHLNEARHGILGVCRPPSEEPRALTGEARRGPPLIGGGTFAQAIAALERLAGLAAPAGALVIPLCWAAIRDIEAATGLKPAIKRKGRPSPPPHLSLVTVNGKRRSEPGSV